MKFFSLFKMLFLFLYSLTFIPSSSTSLLGKFLRKLLNIREILKVDDKAYQSLKKKKTQRRKVSMKRNTNVLD